MPLWVWWSVGMLWSTYEQSTRIPLACTSMNDQERARLAPWTSRFDRFLRSRRPIALPIEASRKSRAVPFRRSPISPWYSSWPAAPSSASRPRISPPVATACYGRFSGSTGFAATTCRALSPRSFALGGRRSGEASMMTDSLRRGAASPICTGASGADRLWFYRSRLDRP
jgi:hypothetical protein